MKKQIYLSILFAVVLLLSGTLFASVMPRSLLIYYGYPSYVNSCHTTHQPADCAAVQFGSFHYLVLGNGLELNTHPDHHITVSIIQQLHQQSTEMKIFGYSDLVVLSQETQTQRLKLIQDWKDMGVDGILLDNFGYDFFPHSAPATVRHWQNQLADDVHAAGLSVIANGFRPDDVFGRLHNEAPAKLRQGDYYLYESYQYSAKTTGYDGEHYVPAQVWRDKMEELSSYLKQPEFAGVEILATTTSETNDDVATKYNYGWYSALLDGLAGYGWGVNQFSASGKFTNQALHVVPSTDKAVGDKFLSDVQHVDNREDTFVRQTNTGTVTVDAKTHTGQFS